MHFAKLQLPILDIVNFFTMLATNGSGFVRRCGSTGLVGGFAALCIYKKHLERRPGTSGLTPFEVLFVAGSALTDANEHIQNVNTRLINISVLSSTDNPPKLL